MLAALQNKLYDRSKINHQNLMFSNKDLKILLFPLVVEQILNSFMGMADTMMVSNVGSTAISAVSLVDSINNLVVQIFSAMAVGGTIVCSQYLGREDKEGANKAARQVVLSMLVISAMITIIGIIGRESLLRLIFGQVEYSQILNTFSSVYFIFMSSFIVESFPLIAFCFLLALPHGL